MRGRAVGILTLTYQMIRLMPWKFLVKHAARRYGVLDPAMLLARMRRFARTIAPAVVSLGLSLAASADGLIVVRELPPGVQPVPGGHPAWAPLEVRYHHVTARVTGRVAVTEVDQVFYNPGGSRLEGTYLFPVPKGAQIDRFSMDVNGKMTDADP